MPRQERNFGFLTDLRKVLPAVAIFLLLLLAPVLWFKFRHPPVIHGSSDTSGPASRPPANSTQGVGCLGYIEPKDGVLAVSSAYLEGHAQRVLEPKVREGQAVRAGQLLAILDGQEALQSAVRLADTRADLAQKQLAQAKAGASESDIAAQKANVSQLTATLANERADYDRFSKLRKGTDVSEAELETRRLAVETAEQRVHEADDRLQSLSHVRPEQVDVAKSELDVAMAEAASARVNLKSATVYAPT